MRSPLTRAASTLVALAAVVLASACGYRTGLGPSAPPEPLPETALDLTESVINAGSPSTAGLDASRSIGIQIFGNESQMPNLERELHAAFTRSARRHASMRLVAPRGADLYVRGRIAGFRRGTGARTTGNQVVETLEIVTIEAELIDGSTGRVVGRAQAQPIVGTAIDVPGREAETRDRALANAADRLLLLLLAGLEYGVTRPGDPLLPEFRTPVRRTSAPGPSAAGSSAAGSSAAGSSAAGSSAAGSSAAGSSAPDGTSDPGTTDGEPPE